MANPKPKVTTSTEMAPKNSTAGRFFQLQSLGSLETFLKAENATTGTAIENLALLKFIELRGDGAVMLLPPRTCAEGHFLLIRLAVKNLFEFEFTAKITELEKHADGLHVAFEFSQVEKNKWNAFIEEYSKRQSDISSIVEKIRS